MRVDTRDMISVTEAQRQGVSALVRRVQDGGTVAIVKSNKVSAIVIGEEAAERLNRLDEMEDDMRLMAVALVRLATDNGVRYGLDDVLAGAGLSRDDLEDDGD